MARMKRTAASRRRNTAWNRFWLFPGVAALAIAAWSVGGGTAASVWLACLIVVAGGVLVGVLAAQDKSSPRQLPAWLAPIPVLAFASLVLASTSESNTDLLVSGLVVGITLVLFEIPLAMAFRYTSGRRNKMLIGPRGEPEASALDRELDLATDHGRATTVVREYLADAEGRGHLEADTKALVGRGYDRCLGSRTLDRVRRKPQSRFVALLANFLTAGQQAKIVRRRSRLRSAQMITPMARARALVFSRNARNPLNSSPPLGPRTR
jgi:hypothetical protein